MIYPSHYGAGYFGFKVPDANPTGTINKALIDAINRNAALEKPATIRPWLQSFTATWVRGHITYGPAEVRAQINAALALGIDEYLIWNAQNRYFPAALVSATEAEKQEIAQAEQRQQQGLDVLGRTKQNALHDFMTAIQKKNWRNAYQWQARDFAVSQSSYQAWVASWTGSVVSYTLTAESQLDAKTVFTVDLMIKANTQTKELKGEFFDIVIENSVWKVKPSSPFIEALTALQV